MVKLINDSNKILEQNKLEDEKYKKIKKIIGVSIGKCLYLNNEDGGLTIDSPIRTDLFNKIIGTVKDNYNDITQVPHVSEQNQDIPFMKLNNITNYTKPNFYIKENKNKIEFNIINFNKTPLYQYLNETNIFGFMDNFSLDELNSFNLHRIKFACFYIFETTDNNYGVVNFPSEIIDITIAKKEDYKARISENRHYSILIQKQRMVNIH